MRWTGLYPIYYLRRYGYLREQNWYSSYNRAQVIGPDGLPMPWLTYSAVHFIEARMKPTMRVFEFGAGNSTHWWARHSANVVAVEHNPEWFDRVAATLPQNAELLLKEIENGDYCQAAEQQPERFDLICIDGRERVDCARHSIDALKPDGVIVWDNTDRDSYQEGFDFLAEHGFRRIDFHGMGSRCVEAWTTSIFYRSDNCLMI